MQLGSPRRLVTIFDVNMRAQFGAARWRQQAENADSRPYLMYDAKLDGRTRPAHRAMDGLVFRQDDPIWNIAQKFTGAFSFVPTAPGTLYKVRLPKGARAVVENEVEQEVLLGPGTKFRVAEIVDNAEIGADPLYRGPPRVYILEPVEEEAK